MPGWLGDLEERGWFCGCAAMMLVVGFANRI